MRQSTWEFVRNRPEISYKCSDGPIIALVTIHGPEYNPNATKLCRLFIVNPVAKRADSLDLYPHIVAISQHDLGIAHGPNSWPRPRHDHRPAL